MPTSITEKWGDNVEFLRNGNGGYVETIGGLHLGVETPDTGRTYANTSFGGTTHDHETYRARNKPELYDEWYVEMVNEQRRAYVESLDLPMVDWDCDTCQSAVLTPVHEFDEHTYCPNCAKLVALP